MTDVHTESNGALPLPPAVPDRPARPHTHAMHHDSTAAGMALAEMEHARRLEKDKRQWRRAEIYGVGRMLMGLLFLTAGIGKAEHFQRLADTLADMDLSDPALLLGVSVVLELVGGALLLLGLWARPVAVGLIAYLVCVSLLLLHDLTIDLNAFFALSNLAFCGGLLMVTAHGSGVMSLDRFLEHRRLRLR